MKWLNINVPLGVSETPIGTYRKCDIFGAVGNVFGAMINSADVKATNEANQWMNIATNEANRQINESQLAWARENYELEKAENRFLVDQAYSRELENRDYNSPAREMQRLRAAGLNPYLAKYGVGSGSGSSSISASVGSPARHNQPSMIPMQNGTPMIPDYSFGEGLSRAVDAYYRGKESDRADYALAADITFRDRKAIQDSLNYLLELKKHGLNDKWVNANIDHLIKSDRLAQNNFEKMSQWQNFQWELQNYQIAQRDTEIELQKLFNDSNISLNRAQANNLLQLVKESVQRVESMKHNDKLSDKEFYHLVGEDLFHRRIELSRLGIDVEKQPFEKFGLLFGAAAQTVGLGLGAYMGLRSGVSHSGIGNRNTVVRGFGY